MLRLQSPWLVSAVLQFGFISGAAGDWVPTTRELLQSEKTGYGGLCGLAVDHATGAVFIDLSDRGIYRSDDQGKTWRPTAGKLMKGRTEWPGCLLLDPTGNSKRLVSAFVYGAPIGVSDDEGKTWRFMDGRSSHIDWCAAPWSDPGMKFVLALKHESGDRLIVSRDGGKSFTDVGQGFGPAWVFDGQSAVVAETKTKDRPNPRLLRTDDAAHTFKPCGTFTAKALPKWHGDRLYWVVDQGLIASDDKGKTWRTLGPLKGGRYGPIFGKTDEEMFVLTAAGITASTNGGATWSSPLALPKEVRGSTLTWMDYDPRHDVLYVMKMGSQLYKSARK